MTVSEREWDAAIQAVRAAPRIAFACHLGPDGDALGSMLALAIALAGAGHDVTASWGSDPFEVPAQYGFLPRLDLLVPPERFPAAPDLMITFDAGSIERLGTLEPNARAAKDLLVIDHHVSNERFGTINLVDDDAAASAVVVFELLRRMKMAIDRDIATCLYTGVVTDTGRFQYRNTTPEVHGIAAELLAAGAPHVEITQTIYNTHPVGYLRLAATALDRLEVHEHAGMVWTWVTQQDLTRHGVGMDDIEALIDLVRTADVTDVAVVLKEQPDGVYKVSMRSKGASDVGRVAALFGGGGHALAAGFTSSNGDPRAAIEEIAVALRRP
ncbi:MAG: DHH family phosphoesterase [Actinomycetota bacterium]